MACTAPFYLRFGLLCCEVHSCFLKLGQVSPILVTKLPLVVDKRELDRNEIQYNNESGCGDVHPYFIHIS